MVGAGAGPREREKEAKRAGGAVVGRGKKRRREGEGWFGPERENGEEKDFSHFPLKTCFKQIQIKFEFKNSNSI